MRWADTLSLFAFLIHQTGDSEVKSRPSGGSESPSLRIKRRNNSDFTVCQNHQLTGAGCSSVHAHISLFFSVSHPTHTLARFQRIFLHIMKCHIRKKNLKRTISLQKKYFFKLFFLLPVKSLSFEWTANRQVTWMMSCFGCDPRYPYNSLQTTLNTTWQHEKGEFNNSTTVVSSSIFFCVVFFWLIFFLLLIRELNVTAHYHHRP